MDKLLTSAILFFLSFLPLTSIAFTITNDHDSNFSMTIGNSSCNPLGLIHPYIDKNIDSKTLSAFCKNDFPCALSFYKSLGCEKGAVLTVLVNNNAEIKESYIFPNIGVFITIFTTSLRFSKY